MQKIPSLPGLELGADEWKSPIAETSKSFAFFRMIFVTVSAIGTAAVVGNVHELTFERIEMVIIGTIIAFIANRYLFPYNLKNSNAQLRKMYHASVKEMFEEIDQLLEGNVRPEIIQNLFIVTALIESKSRVNKQIDDDFYL